MIREFTYASNQNKTTKRNFVAFSLGTVMVFLTLTIILGSSFAYGVETYSKDAKPFGVPLDDWVSKWWNWWISLNTEQATPKPAGCLMNNSDSMVMVMNPIVVGKPHQVCEISTKQAIMVPMWNAFAEDSVSEDGKEPLKGKSYEQLSQAAREMWDLGAVTSLVKLDGKPVGKLDVVSSMRGGSLDYKINSMDNVTELFSKGFNVTIPKDTNLPDQNPGTWRSGAHGWYVFLKPLAPGNHTLYYNVGVTGTGPNDHSAEITYDLNVK